MTRPTGFASILAGFALLTLAAPTVRAQDWHGPSGAASWTFASNRLSFPGLVVEASANQRAALSHVYQVSPPYPVANLRLLFVNFAVVPDGSRSPEQCPGNPKRVDFATVFIDGTAYPVTFDGSLSARLDDCGFVWSDPLQDAAGRPVPLPAGTTYYIRSSQSVAAGDRFTRNMTGGPMSGRVGHPNLGEGAEYSAEPQGAKRLSGSVAAFANGSPLTGPAMAIATGWDGSPVYLVVGDSNGAGVGDHDMAVATRGVYGYVGRGLDDAGSGRRNFANLAAPGTRPGDQASTARGEYGLRMQVLRSIPNRPFNRVVSQMGQNGLFTSLPQWQADMRAWWAFWRGTCPDCIVYQTTFPPRARGGGQAFWSDPARTTPTDAAVDLWPTGRRWQANAWLTSGPDRPSDVVVLDVADAFRDPARPDAFKALPGTWRLAGAVTTAPGMSVITVAGETAPTAGDFYVIAPGTPDAQVVQAVAVRGSGPWSLILNGNAPRAADSGTPVVRSPTGDGLHMGSSLHKAGAARLIRFKIDGALR